MNCFAKFLAARLRSIGFAIAGLGFAVKSQANVKVHVVATLVVIALGFRLGVSHLDWAALVAAIGLVWTAELLNTALEQLCDVIEPNRSEHIKRIKDLAAAAVLAAAICAAIIGALVFGPHIFSS